MLFICLAFCKIQKWRRVNWCVHIGVYTLKNNEITMLAVKHRVQYITIHCTFFLSFHAIFKSVLFSYFSFIKTFLIKNYVSLLLFDLMLLFFDKKGLKKKKFENIPFFIRTNKKGETCNIF